MSTFFQIMDSCTKKPIQDFQKTKNWFYYFINCWLLRWRQKQNNLIVFNIKQKKILNLKPNKIVNQFITEIIPFTRIPKIPMILYRDQQKNFLVDIIYQLYYCGLIYNMSIPYIAQQVIIPQKKNKDFNCFVICEYNSLKLFLNGSKRKKIWTLMYKNHYKPSTKNKLIINWKEVFECQEILKNNSLSYQDILHSLKNPIYKAVYDFFLGSMWESPCGINMPKEISKFRRIAIQTKYSLNHRGWMMDTERLF